MTERELKVMLEHAEKRGIEKGIKFMEQKIVSACENGNPIVVDGECYFIRDALSNLRDIIADIEESERNGGK